MRSVPMMAAVFAFAFMTGAGAQDAGKGTVAGHVIFGDTQKPARLVQVVLLGVPAKVVAMTHVDADANLTTQLATAMKNLSGLGEAELETTLSGTDGSFAVAGMAPGDYYAFATAAGYVTPLAQVEAILATKPDLSKPLPGIPVVHVNAGRDSSIDLTLTRGASLSGTVRWDDGTPLSGVVLTAVPASGDDPHPPQPFSMLAIAGALSSLSIADDQGHFRLTGLAPGDYVVKATIPTERQGFSKGMSLTRAMMAPTPLVMFAPSAFRKVEAKSVTLKAGDDVGGEDLVLNMGGLHSVSGRVTSVNTHNGINQASVKLIDTTDKTLMRTSFVDESGRFTVAFVPSGTYTMKVQDAEDTEPAPPDPKKKSKLFTDDKTLRSYKDATATVIVGDSNITDENVELTQKTKTEEDDTDAAAQKLIDGLTDKITK